MLHSGLTKSQPFPLLAAAASPRRTLLAGLLRAACFSSPAAMFHPVTTVTNRAVSPLGPSRLGLGARASFSTAPDGASSVDGGGSALPWLAAANRDGVPAPSVRVSAGRSSSWETSAEKFFSRGEQTARGEVLTDRGSSKELIREEEDNESIDNPKWGRIKDRYRRMAPRDRGSRGERFRRERFDKPEVRQWGRQEEWGRKTWKEAGESTVPKMVGQGVYGVGPVLAALMAGRREFYALYMQEGMDLSGSNKKKKDKKGIEKVLQLAERIGLKIIEASKHDLNMVVDNRPHQGLVLDASPLEMVNTKELEPVRVDGGKAPVWLALDEVMDPQNLGAIIRSAYFFGAEGVVLCAKNSAPLSGVVSKASAGSLELIELLSCRNMMQFLSSSAENGWRVVGGIVAPKAIPLSEVAPGEPTILVLGSEGTGLRPLVERSCTDLVRIPGNVDGSAVGADINTDGGEEGDNYLANQDMKSFLAVESLNVSVAAGVLLYHLAGANASPVSDKPSIPLM
uniref:rRNA methyltransferase 1, mitochondrial n=1 Tax=Leersia perrieri TaxID=77586 RepID=A0A0D9V5G9_9ORYZ